MNTKKTLLEEDDSGGWIYTFADLMTLLLVFFVLLFSLSSVEAERFEKAMRSLNQALQGDDGANSVIDLPHEAPIKTDVPEEIEEVLPATELADDAADKANENEAENQNVTIDNEWSKLTDEFEQHFQVSIAENAVDVGTPKDGKVTIKVKGDVLFPSGSAEFNPEMMTVLDSMVLLLKQNSDLKLSIHGHTDDIPIETTRFPSNWDLSAIRATNVLRYMVRGGLQPERVSATGYGESVPLAPNDSVINRAKNRRLEFVLEKKAE
ncbi:OmpA family protein [Neptuniibacter sp.]|uniref:OmpA/MotB family protein n=1 Tax=Neptuniibacter sp. TaxID=1962643 RepID=UPI0026081A31|nr:OmpA family protein [Neptuniibacter sp.]MCP4597253.1 OmpA family protein [Neptuniibacter sp.]